MTTARDVDRITFEVLDAAAMANAVGDLGEILADAVRSGSGVNFVLPFSAADGEAWWRKRLPDVASGAIRPIVARVDGRIDRVTLLVPSDKPNSPHRAEIQKVIVHRRARRRGLGTGLMIAVAGEVWRNRTDGRSYNGRD